MNNNVYAFALKSTLDEIQSACPDVSNTFIFKDGKILAKGETTDENTANLTINAFNSITERADSLGSLETVTIQGANGRVSITCMNDFYLTTVLSKKADEKYVNTLTRVLIPTVVKLVEKIHPTSADDATLTVEPEPAEEEAAEEDAESAEADENEPAEEEETATTETPEEQETPEVDDEPLLPEPPVTQLIIENLGGLLVPSDTVRIDKAVITQWNDLYGDKKLEEVDLETLNGKTTRCKFKHIKDSKHKEKGIIQMPEKIQLTLEVAKGELVMVKPVVE
jgi:predicted regulator of Ras-like GTPase activity (Roadblock/LC7/MglB family)